MQYMDVEIDLDGLDDASRASPISSDALLEGLFSFHRCYLAAERHIFLDWLNCQDNKYFQHLYIHISKV